MNWRSAIAFSVLVLGGVCAAAQPPNIALIVADDLGYGDLSCYGAPDIHTPTLDNLARAGVRFTSFYSNGPECSPTRTALMTGRYQHRLSGLECAIGVHNVGRYDDAERLASQGQLGLPADEANLVSALKKAGYHCGLFGKWHLGYERHFQPRNYGFERTFGILGGNADYFQHTEEDGWNVLIDDDQLVKREGYLTTLFTDAALDWYARIQRTQQPFFLYLPYTSPHTPLQGPGDRDAPALSGGAPKSAARKRFQSMVEHMDSQIARVLAALEHQGPHRETLVIFMSDNGGDGNGRNAPWSGRKGTTYEGGIRVPCIVRWPGHLPEGRVVPNAAITMDLTASLLRIAGVPSRANRPLDGIDILREIEADDPATDRTLFWRGRRGQVTWKAVRDGRWKRIWKLDGDQRQSWLFDLDVDPRELHDLATARPDDVVRLDGLLADWEREMRSSPEYRAP